jgi:hypothetical protein
LRKEVRARYLADELRMVFQHVLLSVLPELFVVVAPDDLATDTWDLLHALIVRGRKLGKLDERFAKQAAAILC